jgi:hypothetical protein
MSYHLRLEIGISRIQVFGYTALANLLSMSEYIYVFIYLLTSLTMLLAAQTVYSIE